MPKMSKVIFLISLVGQIDAFQIRPGNRPLLVSLRSQAENHLKELATEWETLEHKVKEFVKSPNRDTSEASELTTALLKTAIDHAHTQEEIEEEHAIQAHQVYEDARLEENQLSTTLPLAPDGTDGWMEPTFRVATRLHEDGTLLEELFYQYLVSEKDPVVSGEFDRPNFNQMVRDHKHALHYKEVLHQREAMAQEEEHEALRTLEELRKNEELLQETLMQFEALQVKQKEKLEGLEKIKQLRRKRKAKQLHLLNELA